ncbi:hypothetical protein T492DRAFT_837126 [Pavlovales sp. CCMP2436]|nr:hypothetical protein T492DRAFT_837126 [Pavlovales sp. CCMP2436]
MAIPAAAIARAISAARVFWPAAASAPSARLHANVLGGGRLTSAEAMRVAHPSHAPSPLSAASLSSNAGAAQARGSARGRPARRHGSGVAPAPALVVHVANALASMTSFIHGDTPLIIKRAKRPSGTAAIQGSAQLHSMRGTAELAAELAALDLEEAALAVRLAAELTDMGDLRARLAGMRGCRAELDVSCERAAELARRVSATAGKAQRMSVQVRELDLAQSRVQETLSVVTAASQLAKSAAIVSKAMTAGRFEEAAAHIHSVVERLGDDVSGDGGEPAIGPASAANGRPRSLSEDDGRERDSVLLAQILAARDLLRERALSLSLTSSGLGGADAEPTSLPPARALRRPHVATRHAWAGQS